MTITAKQAVKFKRRALRWSLVKLAAESKRTVEEIRNLEDGESNDAQLIAELLAPMDDAIAQVLPLWERVISDPALLPTTPESKANRQTKLVEFGKLLRDQRNKAQLSRLQLAKIAGLSDATIKFIETARHPPSRRTCQALVAVKALNLEWKDVATLGYVGPPPSETTSAIVKYGQADPPANAAPALAISDQTDQISSALVAQPSNSGEVIEEETITYTRRIVRKK